MKNLSQDYYYTVRDSKQPAPKLKSAEVSKLHERRPNQLLDRKQIIFAYN